MKVVLALLADHQLQNLVRKMALEMNVTYGAALHSSVLPAHVSLKESFCIPYLPDIEAYFDEFAVSIAPFEITFDRIYYLEWNGNGIVGLDVAENDGLRQLHNRLNTELASRFADTSAPHDGADYRFHLTIEMGPASGDNAYKRYYDGFTPKELALHMTARELTLFLNPGEVETGPYIAYKTLYLGQPADAGEPLLNTAYM